MAVDPFLAGLPDPFVIEEISFEAILASMKADLINRFPAIGPILALESSAAVKVMEVCAGREMILRARTNDAALANLLAYATGSDLDHVGAGSSPAVARMLDETDERFRARILLTVKARNVGSKERYELVALNTDTRVRSAIAYRDPEHPRDHRVYVALLSTEETGVASQDLIDAVEAAFDLPENRLVNGDVIVRSAVTTVVNITAALTVLPGAPPSVLANAEAALRAAWATEGGLGRDLTLDWIRARLRTPDVYAITVTAPASDTIKSPFEAVAIGTVTLTIAGENQ